MLERGIKLWRLIRMFPCSQDGEQAEQKEACYTVCGPGVAEVLEKLYESLFLLSNV